MKNHKLSLKFLKKADQDIIVLEKLGNDDVAEEILGFHA